MRFIGSKRILLKNIEYVVSQNITKYEKSRKFDKNAYFRDIFLPNLDIWGLLMSYSVVVENNSFNYGRRLADLFYNFLYLTSTTVIDTNELIQNLKNI